MSASVGGAESLNNGQPRDPRSSERTTLRLRSPSARSKIRVAEPRIWPASKSTGIPGRKLERIVISHDSAEVLEGFERVEQNQRREFAHRCYRHDLPLNPRSNKRGNASAMVEVCVREQQEVYPGRVKTEDAGARLLTPAVALKEPAIDEIAGSFDGVTGTRHAVPSGVKQQLHASLRRSCSDRRFSFPNRSVLPSHVPISECRPRSLPLSRRTRTAPDPRDRSRPHRPGSRN